MVLKKIVAVLIIFFFIAWTLPVYALTPKEEKWVITLKSPGLAYEAPDWVSPYTLDEAPEDISYWLDVLPFEEDKNADMYVVLPTIWVVTPVIFVPEGTKDYKDMVAWKQIEINNYLDRWVMHYPRSGMPWDIANPVIFGHSNFFVDGVWDYKTIFADIMNLDASPYDEMWVYVKEDSGSYDLRKFAIEQSYETVPEDVEVMIPQWGKELTVFACTNWLAWRWILKWRYIEDNEILVPYPLKWQMYELMSLLDQKSSNEKKKIITTVMSRIDEIMKSIPNSEHYHYKFKRYILTYIERELALKF